MPYTIEFTASALREFKALERAVQRRIAAHINELAQHPFAPGLKKLQGGQDLYRIRVGDYRVIYRVEGKRVAIVVIKIGHRRDVYR
ncbi:MAG: type II toxin-antitoxin system RelE/ParE family toxin [Terriglobales bacterium]